MYYNSTIMNRFRIVPFIQDPLRRFMRSFINMYRVKHVCRQLYRMHCQSRHKRYLPGGLAMCRAALRFPTPLKERRRNILRLFVAAMRDPFWRRRLLLRSPTLQHQLLWDLHRTPNTPIAVIQASYKDIDVRIARAIPYWYVAAQTIKFKPCRTQFLQIEQKVPPVKLQHSVQESLTAPLPSRDPAGSKKRRR